MYAMIIYRWHYFAGIQVFYKDFAIEDIPRYIFKPMEKLISRNTSQQLLQRLQLLAFSSALNNINQAFHLLFYLLVDNQVTEFFKEFRNDYVCNELSITLTFNNTFFIEKMF